MAIDKHRLHHWWRVLRHIKVWHLLVLLIVSGGVSIELLRQNNLGMIERRNLVKQADEQNGDVHKALVALQQYVTAHMNTDMGDKGIYLEHTYQRAYDRGVQESLQDDSASRSLYEAADAACHATFSRTQSFPAYTQCVAEKLVGQVGNDPLSSAKLPSVDLYRYNFISPIWSTDAAGIWIAESVLLSLLLFSRIILYWVLYGVLKRRHQW
jgi:hypothetical protein